MLKFDFKCDMFAMLGKSLNSKFKMAYACQWPMVFFIRINRLTVV